MSDDGVPWICPSCAHFIVRQLETAASPTHDCEVDGVVVEFVPYIDSEQALNIRNTFHRPLGSAKQPRSI